MGISDVAYHVLGVLGTAVLLGRLVYWWKARRRRRQVDCEQRVRRQAAENARALHQLAADARRRNGKS